MSKTPKDFKFFFFFFDIVRFFYSSVRVSASVFIVYFEYLSVILHWTGAGTIEKNRGRSATLLFTLKNVVIYLSNKLYTLLKVAESLINPFGEDDDDFDTNYIIDR